MYYYVKVTAIVDKVVGGSYTMYRYESPIKTILGLKYKIPKELKEEILKWAENKFNEVSIKFDEIVIEKFTHSYQGLSWMKDEEGKEWTEDMLNTYELSRKEYEEYEKTVEAQKEYLTNYRIPQIITDIKYCRDLTEELDMLDSQEYLSFLDTLNRLSIDQDRPDTIKGKES